MLHATRRMTSVAATLVALVLLAAACGDSTPEASGDEHVELVWAIGGVEAQLGGGFHHTAERWNELHPNGPTVRIEPLPREADGQRERLAQELDAENPRFDILGVDVSWMGEFAQNGWLESLEDARPRIEEASLDGPFETALWAGELWGAPYNTNAGLLYYRTDLVAAPPKTWEELVEVGMRVAEEEGIAPFVGQGAQYEGMVVNFLEYFWGAGGQLFDEEVSEVTFEEGPALRAVEFMRSAQETGFYAPGFDTMTEAEARDEFQSGKAVFMRNWPYDLNGSPAAPSGVAGRFAVAPLPTFTGQGTVAALGGFNLGVSPFSDHVEAAKLFVVFASTDPEVQRTLGENSLAPAMAAAYEDLADDPLMAQLATIVPAATPRPSVPEWSEISDEIQQQIFPAYQGQRDARQAVRSVRQFLESIIAGA